MLTQDSLAFNLKSFSLIFHEDVVGQSNSDHVSAFNLAKLESVAHLKVPSKTDRSWTATDVSAELRNNKFMAQSQFAMIDKNRKKR